MGLSKNMPNFATVKLNSVTNNMDIKMNNSNAKVFKLIIISFLISALGSLNLRAQIRGNNIVVSVTPDHQDWNYKVGEKANFTVNVRKSGTLLDNVKIDYEAGPAMFPEVKKSTTLKDGTMKWSGALKQPGFYRFKVIAHVDGDRKSVV